VNFTRSIKSLAFGKAQELQAARHLQSQGLQLVSRNYRSRFGEIDLIMTDSKTLVFVEVRYRRNNSYGDAIDSVTTSKQKRIRLTAAYYLQSHPRLQHSRCRFDVIGLSHAPAANGNAGQLRFDWIKNAFY